MPHTHKPYYSWYNVNLKKAFYWHEKALLTHQRDELKHLCINVESDITISKKQMMKGPSKALQARVNKNLTSKPHKLKILQL